jgi:nucleoside-diphosphate-sugar epimerase
MTKLCVTGVPGWLGSRLVEIIADGGYGDPRAPALPAVEHLSLLIEPGLDAPAHLPAGVRVVKGDVRDPRAVAEAVAGCDAVFHLAAIIHPGWRGLEEVRTVNAGGTENVVAQAIAAGVKRLVYVSSNSVAGTSTALGRPFRETDPPRPYLVYGETKAAGERAVLQAAAAGQLEGVILRACWYYGPHQADRQTRFFRMVAKGNPVMFGAGHNLRSLTYVDHLVAAVFAAATTPEADGRTYWIADTRPYETVEIYNAIADALGVPHPQPRKLPALVSKACALADHVMQRAGIYFKEVHVAGEMAEDIACSVDRARAELGYEPWVTLQEGMQRSVAWCRSQGLAV